MENQGISGSYRERAYASEDGRDVRYFHRVFMSRWYVPVDNETRPGGVLEDALDGVTGIAGVRIQAAELQQEPLHIIF